MPRATGPVYVVPFLRRRTARTNYAKRLALLKSGRLRLVVRRTGNQVLAQLIAFENVGDKTLVAGTSAELAKKFGYPGRANIPSAYLVGLLVAAKAKKAGIKSAVLDLGLATATKNCLAYFALKGAVDGGLEIPATVEVDEKRLNGAHIAAYATALKGKPEHARQFGAYAKAGQQPERLPELFAKAKEHISRS